MCSICDTMYCSKCIKSKRNKCTLTEKCKSVNNNLIYDGVKIRKLHKIVLNCEFCTQEFKYEMLENHLDECKNYTGLLTCKLCKIEIRGTRNDVKVRDHIKNHLVKYGKKTDDAISFTLKEIIKELDNNNSNAMEVMSDIFKISSI